MNFKSLSIIIPCYQEVDNILPLCGRLSSIASQFEAFEVILVDDDSKDGTEVAVRALQKRYSWLTLRVRQAKPSLSLSVIAGFDQARNEVLLCMDADLSHPPEKIPDLVQALESADFVLGSRFMQGAKLDQTWHWFRVLNAFVAKQFGRVLTHVSDPMSGFFALRKSDYQKVRDKLNPIGYKIALELIVKLPAKKITEVPIHFVDRVAGQSKLTTKEMLKFLKHFSRLLFYRMRHKNEK